MKKISYICNRKTEIPVPARKYTNVTILTNFIIGYQNVN